MRPLSKQARIAVAGGGISGLTFAAEMRAQGFAHVTVFERAERVGGKTRTVDIEGRPHDLGATMGLAIDYEPVLRHSRAAGIPTLPFPTEIHYDTHRGGPRTLNRRRELPRIFWQAGKYLLRHALQWRGADGTGLHRAPALLHRPWAEVARELGLEAISERTLVYRAGYGYGFDDEVAALLYANLLRPQTFLGLWWGGSFMWQGGTQPIWEALAQKLDVRTGTPLLAIERNPDGVILQTKNGREEFDALVIACNPQELGAVLDASDDEQGWFDAIRTYPYATFACSVPGLSDGRAQVGYLDENMVRGRAGHPMAWVKRYADSDICVFHLLAPPSLTDEQIGERIAHDMQRLGGRMTKIHVAARWQFFPHFPPSFMQAGGLSAIAAWQGTRRTYLIGEVLSFATMARVAELATRTARTLGSTSLPNLVGVA